MHHLSALDTLFLHLESAQTPMHVGSLFVLAPPARGKAAAVANIRKHLTNSVHLAPLFTRKLQVMPLDLANPVWIAAGKIDLDYHIVTQRLPKPGSRVQLEALVAKLHEGLLDRDRPLWQFHIIEGLQDGSVGFYAKLHHAALDGQGGVALAQALLATEPTPPRGKATHKKARAALQPSTAKLLGAALSNTLAQTSRLLGAIPDALKTLRASLESGRKPAVGAKAKAGAKGKQSAKAFGMKNMALGPRTPLNTAIGSKRTFATVSLPLAEAKAIARHFDVKLNDVVLAVVAGALRKSYAKDKALLSKAMIGAVPASLRAPGDTSQSNQVTMMLVSLATEIADPVKRLAAIHAASNQAKKLTGGVQSVMPSDLPSLGLPWLMGGLASLYSTAVETEKIPVLANLVISNVPGPQVPLYLAGARVTSYVPVSIVMHGLGLNITILSYDGVLGFGLIAAKGNVANIRTWAKHIEAAHRELLALVVQSPQQRSAKSPKTTRKRTRQ